MKIKEISNIIEKTASMDLAYSWDNVGLLIGDENKSVKKALLTLDININTVNEAIENKCDIIISHHPIMFGGIKRIDYNTPTGKMLALLIKNDIAVYAAHTNLDTACGGINDRLAELFNIKNINILEYHTDRADAGLGRYGEISEVSFRELCEITKKNLKTTYVRAAGDFEKRIKKLCIASGSCSESIETAVNKGCDAVITGDMKYHDMIDYTEMGICIIDAGHYPTETIAMDIFEDILKDIEVIKSKNKDIFNYI